MGIVVIDTEEKCIMFSIISYKLIRFFMPFYILISMKWIPKKNPRKVKDGFETENKPYNKLNFKRVLLWINKLNLKKGSKWIIKSTLERTEVTIKRAIQIKSEKWKFDEPNLKTSRNYCDWMNKH